MKKHVLSLVVVSLVFVLPGRGDSWQEIVPNGVVPPARAGHTMTFVNNRIYAFGGDDENRVPTHTLSVFDVRSMRWVEHVPASNPPPARHGHNAVAYWGNLYIFFGQGVDGLLGDIWRYDPAGNTWNPVNAGGTNQPTTRSHASGNLIGNTAWFFGGYINATRDGTTTSGDLWAYNFGTNRWTRYAANANASRAGSSMFRDSSRIYIYGGEVDGVPTNTTWVYASDEPGPGLPPPQTSQFTLSFAEGWNVFSLPLEPVNPAVEAVLAEGTGRATLYRGDVWQWKPIGATGGGAYRMVDTLRALTG